MTVIGVKFKKAGKLYSFSSGELEIEKGMGVIVETARGVEYGTMVMEFRDIPQAQMKQPMKTVIRIATEEDNMTVERNAEREKEAFSICVKAIARNKLDMRLTDVEYIFDGSRIVFYFTADGRVDFRELVKDLASTFKTRIELRQIGVRDETKMTGGIGICGRVLCCNSFMNDFHPVSIKMAKDQSLSLNPGKISGSCGRLMCCLKYEHEAYRDLLRNTPGIGTIIETADGKGTIVDVNLLTGRLKVKLEKDNDTDWKHYHVNDVVVLKIKKKYRAAEEEQVDISALKNLED